MGGRLETQLELDQFLMFDLADLCGTIEDQELRAYALAMTIGATGGEISESWLSLYLSTCPVDKTQIDIHLSVFFGMQLINVTCDCNKISCEVGRLQSHAGYHLGSHYLSNESPQYKDAKIRVEALREELFA
jgi:hypothetical protein